MYPPGCLNIPNYKMGITEALLPKAVMRSEWYNICRSMEEASAQNVAGLQEGQLLTLELPLISPKVASQFSAHIIIPTSVPLYLLLFPSFPDCAGVSPRAIPRVDLLPSVLPQGKAPRGHSINVCLHVLNCT